jgi:hypothetical protein
MAALAVQSGSLSENSKGFTSGSTASPPALNTWYHGAGVFESASSRLVYIDGSNSSAANSNGNSITPSGVNSVTMGARYGPTLAGFMNGRLAEVGIWNVALTAAEIASLAKGMTCDKVRPQSLVFYAPLIRELQDLRGGLAITNNNTATVANHPRVYA